MDYKEEFFMAKYHFSIVERMFRNYESFPDKRIFIGILNELARTVNCLIKSYIIYEGFKNYKDVFLFRKISRKYIQENVCDDLLAVLEIEKSRKNSPIDYQKQDKIILLEKGKYKVLSIEKLKELSVSIKQAILKFPC